jgi:hypothetical protein
MSRAWNSELGRERVANGRDRSVDAVDPALLLCRARVVSLYRSQVVRASTVMVHLFGTSHRPRHIASHQTKQRTNTTSQLDDTPQHQADSK